MTAKIENKALRLLKPGYTPAKSKDIKAYSRIYCNDLIDILYKIAADEENFPRELGSKLLKQYLIVHMANQAMRLMRMSFKMLSMWRGLLLHS